MPAKNRNQLATKADIANLNRKIDGTKAEVNRLDGKIDSTAARLDSKIDAVKTALKEDFRRLAVAQVRMQGDIGTMREDMKELATKQDIGRVLSAIDSFAAKAETFAKKALSHPAILQDHEARLRDHEKRLGRLEGR